MEGLLGSISGNNAGNIHDTKTTKGRKRAFFCFDSYTVYFRGFCSCRVDYDTRIVMIDKNAKKLVR